MRGSRGPGEHRRTRAGTACPGPPHDDRHVNGGLVRAHASVGPQIQGEDDPDGRIAPQHAAQGLKRVLLPDY